MYNHAEAESKWQKIWDAIPVPCIRDNENYLPPRRDSTKNKKYYVLEMYPYPSGDLHIGQFRNYVLGDTIARLRMMQGFDVLHPFGWDAFGLPAEQAAIKKGFSPREWTLNNISQSRSTLKLMGISYDWSREIITCEPDYYKWNQWLFIKLLEKGLAYRKESYVNWCSECHTSLANEQIENGKCWRCHSEVGVKNLTQWFIKITDYAEKLLTGLDKLTQWPEQVKTLQRNWLGKSEGVEILFKYKQACLITENIPIFTTRADTIYGVTFLAIAPESKLASRLGGTTNNTSIKKYIEDSLKHSEFERGMAPKTGSTCGKGIFTGEYAIHPLSKEKIPIWVADYVLPSYGTGIIMGVPAHDTRDYEFAMLNKIEIKQVIRQKTENRKQKTEDRKQKTNKGEELPYTGEGIIINSADFSGMDSVEGRKKIETLLEEKELGRKKVNYRLHDWLISRQRYWGTPIPVIHCDKCGSVPVPESELPVILPQKVDFIPGMPHLSLASGNSPLVSADDFIHTKCPKCNRPALRDSDTMDTFVDSSWYFLRYMDPKLESKPFSQESAKKWLPVDEYIGGIEHASGHLIYFRFITKFLYTLGLVPYDEPCIRLFTQGMITDQYGKVMSKSKGNAIPIRPFVEKWGADNGRLTILFLGPPAQDAAWSEDGVRGSKRFMDRVYTLLSCFSEKNVGAGFPWPSYPEVKTHLYRELNRTIEKVTEGIENYSHNTAIAALMAFVNELYKNKDDPWFNYSYATLIQLLAPFTPHLSEELWHKIGNKNSIFTSKWPSFQKVIDENVTIVIEINGKPRAKHEFPRGVDQSEIEKVALKDPKIIGYLEGKKLRKTIWVKDKLINFVIDE